MIRLFTMERDYPYGTLRSTNGSKTKVVLEEKGLAYETVCVRPGDVWKKVPEITARHPLGKVPFIEVDGDEGSFTLYDSTVINEYLNELQPLPALLPSDPQSRALARARENYGDEGILMAALPPLWMPWWSPPEKRDVAGMDRARGLLRESVFPVLAQMLGDQEYLCGEFSLADVPLMAMAMVLEVDDLVPEPPALADYLDRLRARPSYQAIAPATPAA
ncbi:MAG: glutathione S-transferase family protein [Pseudomonadota bacterium]